jgi:hypothetical protein
MRLADMILQGKGKGGLFLWVGLLKLRPGFGWNAGAGDLEAETGIHVTGDWLRRQVHRNADEFLASISRVDLVQKEWVTALSSSMRLADMILHSKGKGGLFLWVALEKLPPNASWAAIAAKLEAETGIHATGDWLRKQVQQSIDEFLALISQVDLVRKEQA